ncbi:hypothetical protein PENARI_c007G05323 [Penicillium arizonense]|uniref:Uncharacterized protein n=1 Tax=Penicillium arizonense TaxID=1835702 RepID=A0A1F5LL06_PENAI|nr:hypothetical protein PENARI_c007G05323 [Penicillium arizonense]OGE53786.1 hypothetical protein PENARI_c007G05323 [Penicillium arizonense]
MGSKRRRSVSTGGSRKKPKAAELPRAPTPQGTLNPSPSSGPQVESGSPTVPIHPVGPQDRSIFFISGRKGEQAQQTMDDILETQRDSPSAPTPQYDSRTRRAHQNREGLQAPPMNVKTRLQVQKELEAAQAEARAERERATAAAETESSSNWKPGRRAIDDLLDPLPLTPAEMEAQAEYRVLHPSANILPRSIFGMHPFGPNQDGLPVGTLRTDDIYADPDCSAEEKMTYRRVVCVNLDNSATVRWGATDYNIHGMPPPRGSVGDETKKKSKKVEVTNKVDFFEEYEWEFRTWTLHNKLLWARKEKIYNWMDSIWHMEWATGWGSAKEMTNDNGQREQWIRRSARIRNDSYTIPFFTDEQMGDDPDKKRLKLIDRMDGAQFKFLPDIAESNKRALQNKTFGSWTHLQERAFHFKRTAEYMQAICSEFDLRYGSTSFNLRTVQSYTRAGGDPKKSLQKLVSPNLLQEPRTQQILGVLSNPIKLEGNNVAMSFTRKDEMAKQKILTNLETAQLPRSDAENDIRWRDRNRLSRVLGPAVGRVVLRSGYLPTTKEEDQEGDETSMQQDSEDNGHEGEVSNHSEEEAQSEERVILLSDTEEGPVSTDEEDSSEYEPHPAFEELRISPIRGFDPANVTPETSDWLAYHEVKGIGLQEYEWLRAQGVTAQVAAFRLDSNQAGREITELNREESIRQHNQVHAILENDKDASSPGRRDTIREGKKPAKPTSPTLSHRKAETSKSAKGINPNTVETPKPPPSAGHSALETSPSDPHLESSQIGSILGSLIDRQDQQDMAIRSIKDLLEGHFRNS